MEVGNHQLLAENQCQNTIEKMWQSLKEKLQISTGNKRYAISFNKDKYTFQ